MGKSDPRDWHQSGVNCWHSTIVCAACGFHSESLSQTSEGPCRRRCGRPVRDYFRSISEVECEGARLDRTASGGPTSFRRIARIWEIHDCACGAGVGGVGPPHRFLLIRFLCSVSAQTRDFEDSRPAIPGAAPEGRADQRSWSPRTSWLGAAPPRRLLQRRGPSQSSRRRHSHYPELTAS